MRRYGGGILYVALPLHVQRGCFRIRTHDQQVTKAQLYHMQSPFILNDFNKKDSNFTLFDLFPSIQT